MNYKQGGGVRSGAPHHAKCGADHNTLFIPSSHPLPFRLATAPQHTEPPRLRLPATRDYSNSKAIQLYTVPQGTIISIQHSLMYKKSFGKYIVD